MNKPGGYIDIDLLQAQTTLEEAAAKCGVRLPVTNNTGEVRIDCPFGCPGDHAGRKELSVNLDNPQKVFQCHAYQCGVHGNLLTLMHGFLTGSIPTGGKLKGAEFQRVRNLLAGESTPVRRTSSSVDPSTQSTQKKEPPDAIQSPPPKPPRNLPLIESPDERIRELHNIDTKFITDIAAMSPAAAAYVRKHPALSPESMKKWRCGYLPHDGGGDKRAWSLLGNIIYPVLSWLARGGSSRARRLFFRHADQSRPYHSPPQSPYRS